jgi:hypothetical protein
MGRIPADYLPPKELWPVRAYKLSEFQTYPQRLNSTEELLDKQVAAGKGDRIAIYFEDKRIPYKAVLANVNKLGSALKRLGIEEADRVILRLPNIPGGHGQLRHHQDRRGEPAHVRAVLPGGDHPRRQPVGGPRRSSWPGRSWRN